MPAWKQPTARQAGIHAADHILIRAITAALSGAGSDLVARVAYAEVDQMARLLAAGQTGEYKERLEGFAAAIADGLYRQHLELDDPHE